MAQIEKIPLKNQTRPVPGGSSFVKIKNTRSQKRQHSYLIFGIERPKIRTRPEICTHRFICSKSRPCTGPKNLVFRNVMHIHRNAQHRSQCYQVTADVTITNSPVVRSPIGQDCGSVHELRVFLAHLTGTELCSRRFQREHVERHARACNRPDSLDGRTQRGPQRPPIYLRPR